MNKTINRRNFMNIIGSAAAGATLFSSNAMANSIKGSGKKFNCKFAPNIYDWTGLFPVSTKGMSPADMVSFYADLGFTALEDNDMMNYPVAKQNAIAKRMEKEGMQMGTFTSICAFNDTYITANRKNLSEPADQKAAIKRTVAIMKKAVEVAKRVNAKWTTLVLGLTDYTLDGGKMFENAIEHLRAAAEICEPAKLTMILEPLSHIPHPQLWLQKASDASMLCKAVNSPYCKMLFDVYHQQITEGNLINNIDSAWENIAYFHLGDVPHRTEPQSGEINFKNLIAHIHAKGYRGIYGMEHRLSEKSLAGEIKMLNAYREIDVAG